jgi:hypothetical protein
MILLKEKATKEIHTSRLERKIFLLKYSEAISRRSESLRMIAMVHGLVVSSVTDSFQLKEYVGK